MQCPECGQRVAGRAVYCPQCGHRLGHTQKLEPTARFVPLEREAAPIEIVNTPPTTQRHGCGLSLLVVLLALLAMVAVLGIGVLGGYYGLRDRANVERQAAAEHYRQGLAHLNDGQTDLAIAEFEVVLTLDSKHEQAAARLVEARQKREARPTATAMPTALARVTYEADFAALRAAYERGDWPRVLALAESIISADPTYRRSEVNQMVFEATYQSGLKAVAEGRMEEGVRLFNAALLLQPNHAPLEQARRLATLYLAGTSFWGADWGKTTENLAALYRLAPDYKDVRQRTYDAYVAYGDALGEQGDWCSAEQEYGHALEISAVAALTAKRGEASARCKAGPVASPGGTPAPSGTYVGRITEQIGMDQSKMFIRGKVVDKSDKGVPNVRVQIQAWDWKAIAVTDGNGLFSFDGLANPVTYTLTLPDLPSRPLDVPGVWGKITFVSFQEAR